MRETIRPAASHLDVEALLARVRAEHWGFLCQNEITALAQHPQGRLTLVLIRCGACRFLCAAQDVAHLTRCVEAGGDYVRDISLPAEA